MRIPSLAALFVLCASACQDTPPKPEDPPPLAAKDGDAEAGVDIRSPKVPEDTWLAFASEEGRYRARFPSAPSKDSSEVPTVAGNIVFTTHSAGSDEVHFAVNFGDYPDEVMKNFDLDKGLDGARNGAVNNIGGTLIAEQQITFAGHPARAFQAKATLQGVELGVDARVFMVGGRLYQLMVIHPVSTQNVQADKFFDSFELTG